MYTEKYSISGKGSWHLLRDKLYAGRLFFFFKFQVYVINPILAGSSTFKEKAHCLHKLALNKISWEQQKQCWIDSAELTLFAICKIAVAGVFSASSTSLCDRWHLTPLPCCLNGIALPRSNPLEGGNWGDGEPAAKMWLWDRTPFSCTAATKVILEKKGNYSKKKKKGNPCSNYKNKKLESSGLFWAEP